MQFFTIQNLLHIESIEWIDKETKIKNYAKVLHFSDPKTTRVCKYSFKGDTLPLVVGEAYKLSLEQYTFNEKTLIVLKTLTPEKK